MTRTTALLAVMVIASNAVPYLAIGQVAAWFGFFLQP